MQNAVDLDEFRQRFDHDGFICNGCGGEGYEQHRNEIKSGAAERHNFQPHPVLSRQEIADLLDFAITARAHVLELLGKVNDEWQRGFDQGVEAGSSGR